MPSSHSGLVGTGVATVGTGVRRHTATGSRSRTGAHTIRGRYGKPVSRTISQTRHNTSQGIGITGRTSVTAR